LRASAVVLESLEQRRLLASIAVNFQTSSTSTPSGYLPDTGATYANRGNGYSYGWNADNSANTANDSAIIMIDTPHKTYAKMQPSGVNRTWEIGLPSGTYQVKVVAGDYGNTSSVYDVRVEGQQGPSGTANAYSHWFEKTVVTSVTDGKLTISNGSGASDQRIAFIQIDDVPSLSTPTTAPANLVARAASNTAVDLVWDDTTSNEAEFVIQRKQGTGAYVTIGTTGGGNEYYNFSTHGFFNDTGLTPGQTYTYQVQAKNGAGTTAWSASASVTLPTSSGQAPYRSSPTAPHKLVTSRVDAEDFDIGGSGLGYTDNTTGNYSNLYRRADVDIGTNANEYFVGWNSTGEWTAYTLSVPTTGTYNLVFSQSRSADGGTFQIEQNGVAVTGPIQILGTGNPFTFTTRTIEGIQLTADADRSPQGPSVFTIRILSTPSGSGEAGNLDWFRFDLVGQSVAAPSNLLAPTVQSNSVQLTWDDSGTAGVTYRVERKQGTGAWATLTSGIAAGTETYTDTTVAASTAYTYRVIAVSATLGESPASNERSVATPAGTVSTTTLNPSADTYVRSGTATTNYGTATDILAKLATGNNHREAYIRFDVSSLSGSPSSIILRVNGWRNSLLSNEQPLPFNVIGMTNTTWSESTTTYSNKPDLTGNPVVGTIVADVQENKWYEVDVTSYVQQRIAAGATAVSFAVVGTQNNSDSNLYIISNEGGTNKPQLVVQTSAPAQVPAAPSGLTASVSGTTVNLSWTDNSSNETGFVVERANNSTFTGKTRLSAVTATNRTDQPGPGTWYYRVVAVNAAGDSAVSNTQSVTISTASTNVPVAEDTYVRSPSTNTSTYGSSTTLEVKNNPSSGSNDRRAFVKFGLSAITGPVTSAKLWVYGSKNTGGESMSLEVFSVADTTWNANTMTYASQPSIATPALDTQPLVVDTSAKWYELDVTSYVQAQLTANASAVAFALDLSASSSAFFAIASAESGANAPYLRVTTTAAQPQVPAAPSGLARIVPPDNLIRIGWTSSPTAQTTEIQRSTNGGSTWATLTGTQVASDTDYDDTTYNSTQDTEYRVRSINTVGASGWSNVLKIPARPSAPTATISGGSIVLSWSDVSSLETGYRVERSTDGNNFVSLNPSSLAVASAGNVTYTDTTSAPATLYYYRVRAIGLTAEGLPSPSTEVSAAAPNAPSGLQVHQLGYNAALIS
jgi:hypothetical protein